MAIKDLQARQGNVDITLDVVDVGESRTFEKFGKEGRVATAIGKDETGDIKISLWNDDIDKIKAGDKLKFTNAYVSEWQGELQLSTGKFGSMEVVGEDPDVKKEMTSAPDEAAAKETLADAEKKVQAVEEKLDEQPKVDEEDIVDE